MNRENTMRRWAGRCGIALSLVLVAQGAQAFFCFSFGMGSQGPSFRMSGPDHRVYGFGPQYSPPYGRHAPAWHPASMSMYPPMMPPPMYSPMMRGLAVLPQVQGKGLPSVLESAQPVITEPKVKVSESK